MPAGLALAGISLIGSGLSSMAAADARQEKSDADIENLGLQSANIQETIKLETDSYLQQYSILTEQDNELDVELGGMMSSRGLDALKAEARLRAGAAETGTSGGSTSQVVQNAFMEQALDNAVLLSTHKKSKRNVQRQRISNSVAFRNKTRALKNSIYGINITGTGYSQISGIAEGFAAGSRAYSAYASTKA
ncbi:hypothetical protein OAE88_00630 [bacterium]|nr:hypothetical protein [bacterium]